MRAPRQAFLALDWDRGWLIPANTNTWFPVNIFKDVALPGVYKVTVTGSTNVTIRYGSTRVRGGQSEEVDFPLAQSQETLEVQAAAPGAATLTVTSTDFVEGYTGMLSFVANNLTNELSKAGLNYKTYVDLAPIVSYTAINPYRIFATPH